jgi:phosphoribosylanthranilate isomerase
MTDDFTENWELTTKNCFMTWVKICGMTNLEDALVAVDAGADAVGFVFYEKSPRCVSVVTAREIVKELPERVEKIGVFVGDDENWIETLLRVGLTGTQVYFMGRGFAGSGNGSKAIDRDLLPARFRSLMAFPMSLFDDPESEINSMAMQFAESKKRLEKPIPEGLLDTFLLDSGSVQQPGGTGKVFDWAKAGPISESMRRNGLKLIVAGGLNPENVAEAICILKPWGVDVVSGVEARPGKKDPEKVRAFVRAVREKDKKAS